MDFSCRTALLVSALLLLVSSGVFSQSATTTAAASTTPAVCLTDPPITANANFTPPASRTSGTVVTYSCNPGYTATGSLQRVCRNGSWQPGGPALSCSAVYCPRPKSVSMARTIYGSRYRVGVSVTYNCYTGYMINGSATITCQANKTWTQPLPTCQKKNCGEPPAIPGGNVTAEHTVYYSPAAYTCQPGFDLYYNGYRQRSNRYTIRCLNTGVWAAVPNCKPKDCGLPSNIPNGVRYTQGNHVYGQSVTYECNHGYILQGNGSITCQATGRWSVFPQCKRVECEPPPKVPNASTPTVAKAQYGNSTKYTCHKGYDMSGPAIVSCQSDGTWTQRPVCTLVDCRVPPSIHFGVQTWKLTTFKSEANYKCDKGYKLIGVTKIQCQANGRWTPAPKCELPPGQTAVPGLPSTGQQVGGGSANSDKSALTGLAIACSIFGVITLICLVVLIYKVFIANRALGLPFKHEQTEMS